MCSSDLLVIFSYERRRFFVGFPRGPLLRQKAQAAALRQGEVNVDQVEGVGQQLDVRLEDDEREREVGQLPDRLEEIRRCPDAVEEEDGFVLVPFPTAPLEFRLLERFEERFCGKPLDPATGRRFGRQIGRASCRERV